MQKKYFIYFLAVITILFTGIRGEAFVPQTPHLLHLVVKKIRIPEGMTVTQTRQIVPAPLAGASVETGGGEQGGSEAGFDTRSDTQSGIGTEAVAETGMDTGAGAGPAPAGDGGVTSLSESLTYAFPDRLRSEIRNGTVDRFYALSPDGFARVEHGSITGLEQAPGEYYTDPLLYRDHEIFAAVLARRGINTHKVTLQRLEGEICWFVGEPAYGGADNPGLWIGKDSFFPKRYLLKLSGRTIDVRYGDWQRVSRSWYPGQTQVYVDGELFTTITVDRMALASKLPASLFDVRGILGRYPRKSAAAAADDSDTVQLDTQIDTFNKLYD